MTTQKHQTSEYDFAANLKELEAITAWFETSDIDLTQALAKFERGMELAASLKDHLQEVENRVVKIKQRFDNVPVAGESVSGDDEDQAPPVDLELGLF